MYFTEPDREPKLFWMICSEVLLSPRCFLCKFKMLRDVTEMKVPVIFQGYITKTKYAPILE